MEHPQPFAFDPHREALAALEHAPESVYLLLDLAFRNCVQASSAPKSQGIITAEFPLHEKAQQQPQFVLHHAVASTFLMTCS
jgi:hypothetical protein